MAKRKKIPPTTETEVLTLSKRRCCLCFSLEGDLTLKKGQIAHLDRNPLNNELDNLAWLCIPHHDEYDTRTSQSKGFTINEVKAHRNQLYEVVARMPDESQVSVSSLGPSQPPELILKLFKMGRDQSHRDEIFLSQANSAFPQDHLFGFALENTVAFTMAKGIYIRVRFANRTDTRIAIRFQAPRIEGWTTQVSELVMEQEAILTFRGSGLECLHRHPVEWSNFNLTLWELVKGYILISYDITSVQPHTERGGNLKIHLM